MGKKQQVHAKIKVQNILPIVKKFMDQKCQKAYNLLALELKIIENSAFVTQKSLISCKN